MIITKNIGIWMNHSIAYIMEFTAGLITTITVESNPDYKLDDKLCFADNNSLSLYKEHYIQTAYYKKLEESISDCSEVILFGPTNAKVKLYNLLRIDKRFAKTNIEVTQAQEMNQSEQLDFVTKHFSKNRFLNGAK